MATLREFLPCAGMMCMAAWATAASSALQEPCVPLSPGTFPHAAKGLTLLVSGTPVEAAVSPLASGAQAQIMLDSQFAIDVPAGAESLLFVIRAEDAQEDNFDFAVRFDAPVAVTADGAFADYWVMFPTGYEELGLWGGALAAGRYYAAIITRSATGGKLTIAATINGAFVDVTPDTRTPVLVGAGIAETTTPARRLDGQQYRMRTPADALSLLVELQTSDLGRDACFALRVGYPVGVDPDGGLVANRQIDASGGYGSVCLEGAALAQDQSVYVWVLNAAETLLSADVAIMPDGCARALEPSTSVQGLVPQVPPAAPDGTVVLADIQYVIAPRITAPPSCLYLEGSILDGGEPLSMFVREAAPVAFELRNGAPALIFDREFPLATEPGRILIKPLCLGGEPLYVAIGNRGPAVRAYELSLAAAACPYPYGLHPFRRGDANGDGRQDIADVVHMLGYLFRGLTPAPCIDAFDTDDSGKVDIADPIALLQYFFASFRPPPAPTTTCGADPTADSLTCEDCRGCIPCVSEAPR